MQVAEVLSDLTSLYVCEHAAALNLVSSHMSSKQKPELPGSASKTLELEDQGNKDLQRALDLVDLHSEMKEKHVAGAEVDEKLQQARRDVEVVLRQALMRG